MADSGYAITSGTTPKSAKSIRPLLGNGIGFAPGRFSPARYRETRSGDGDKPGQRNRPTWFAEQPRAVADRMRQPGTFTQLPVVPGTGLGWLGKAR